VREKLGKTYGMYMGYNERANNCIYTVSTSTRSEQMNTTLEAFDKTIADFYSKGITENELKLTKTKMKNEYLAVNNPGSIIEFYNPLVFPDIKKRMNSFAEIDALTLETVNKVIKKYYTPDSYKLIIAGSEKDLSTQLAAIKGLQKFANNIIEADQ
jgi:predicted Zn-dependent peptidase